MASPHFHGFTPQHPRHFPLCLDPRRLTSCHRNHLNSLGMVETLLVVSGDGFLKGGKENFSTEMQKFPGSFSKFLRDPIAFGYVLGFQIIQPWRFFGCDQHVICHISAPAPKIARARRAKVTKAIRVGGITISWEMSGYESRIAMEHRHCVGKEKMESLHQKLNKDSVDGHLVPVGSVLINSLTSGLFQP